MVSTPKAPDPKETAAAQSGMNRDTAITQQQLNMVNQVGPDGSLTYQQTGEGTFTDSQGNTVVTPTYTATTQLSPAQQAIKDQLDGTKLNLGTLANNQSDFLKNYLSTNVDTSGLPALQTDLGPNFRDSIGGSFSTKLGKDYATKLGDGYVTSYAGADDFSADRQKVQDALMARMQPGLEQNRTQLETQLIGRGLRPGTAAWNSEFDRLSRSENDAQLSAILGAGEEQARMVGMARDAAGFGNSAIAQRFGLENASQLARMEAQNAASAQAAGFRNNAALTRAGFNNDARTQGMSELHAERSRPINEITALLSGSQVSMPSFVNTPSSQVGGVDYTGLVSDKYKADVARSQSAMGGLFGLLGAGITAFSDRRLKTAIERIGELANGLGWYRFRYLWDLPILADREGVMSDEVRAKVPQAVRVAANGFDMVDYTMLEAA